MKADILDLWKPQLRKLSKKNSKTLIGIIIGHETLRKQDMKLSSLNTQL